MDFSLQHYLYFGVLTSCSALVRLRDRLVIEGQGTITVRTKPAPASRLSIVVCGLHPSPACIRLDVTETSAKLYAVFPDGTGHEIEGEMPKGIDAATLLPDVEDSYWLSIDKKNGQLRYGKTYRSASSTCLIAKIDIGDNTTKPGPYIWVKKLKEFVVLSPTAFQVSLQAVPIVVDLPPYVMGSADLTLEDLDNGVAAIENLSPECQRLYANIAGPNIMLDDETFPEFSKALEFSIRTPGKLCYEKLKAKAGDFGDRLTTYLRITLGLDQGDSPGIPFVMEIWPAKHRSPVHDHGEAFAIIKVLHGSISAAFFDRLDHSLKRGLDCTFSKGDVTWIGPNHYQIHQLHNDFDRVCVTIQCYQYARCDRQHDEYFDFLDVRTGEKKSFYPNSDWCFRTFKRLIKEEWEAHLKELVQVRRTVIVPSSKRKPRFTATPFAFVSPMISNAYSIP